MAKTTPTPEEQQRQRELAAERKRRQRDRQKAQQPAPAVAPLRDRTTSRRDTVTRHAAVTPIRPDVATLPEPADTLDPAGIRHRLFVAAFFALGCNGTAAYQQVYKVEDAEVAASLASRLLSNAKVAALVDQQRRAIEASSGLTVEWVLSNLVDVARRAMQAEPVLDVEGNPTGEYVFDGKSASRALELIGKHVGMWPTKPALLDARTTVNVRMSWGDVLESAKGDVVDGEVVG